MNLLGGVVETLEHSIIISIFVFSMMIVVDYINILTEGRIKRYMLGNRGKQYVISSLLGVTPGCLGAFMSVSMYVHGIITFGALTACMIATSGDEAFVMLALFPKDAVILFSLLFIIGIVSGVIVDRIIGRINIKVCKECELQEYHAEKIEKIFSRRPAPSLARISMILVFVLLLILNILGIFGPKEINAERFVFLSISGFMIFVSLFSSEHYLREHIIRHIIKRHIWKVFLWTLGALLFVNIIISMFNLETFIRSNMNLILVLSGIVGLIPESGPHLVFVTMYFKGLVPFSVLLTSSIVQDGHGMLPLFSYTIKDSVLMKIINLLIGLAVGSVFYIMGL